MIFTLGATFSVGPGISLPLFTGAATFEHRRTDLAPAGGRDRISIHSSQRSRRGRERPGQLTQEQERRDRSTMSRTQPVGRDLATSNTKAGLVDFLSVLDAQRDLYANEDQLVQVRRLSPQSGWTVSRLGRRLESGANRSHEQVDA